MGRLRHSRLPQDTVVIALGDGGGPFADQPELVQDVCEGRLADLLQTVGNPKSGLAQVDQANGTDGDI